MTVVSTIQKVVILYGGELSCDIANALKDKLLLLQLLPSSPTTPNNNNDLLFSTDQVKLISMSEGRDFKSILNLEEPASTLVVVVAQTIENNAPPEEAGPCVRFLNRQKAAVAAHWLKFQFAVLGLGDSNLLLDRQHTTAKDCNAVAQGLDGRLEQLGATRYYPRGEADERTGLTEGVEPWITGLVAVLLLRRGGGEEEKDVESSMIMASS
jgi:sulfite reductase alpha subunit-like flavoprotein